MRVGFVTADVFTDVAFGGNQLAVIPDARGIPDERLLDIAKEFNYSETVFVYPPASAANTRRVRIFTPGGEVPFAGHPTCGTAHVLAALGEIPLDGETTRIVLEQGVGPVPVTIRTNGDRPVFTQLSVAKLPETGPPPPSRDTLSEILSLEPKDIQGGAMAPQAVSCGLPFLIVPLRSRDAVRRARVRTDRWESALASYWAPEILVVAREGELPGSDLRARMFAPRFSISEDPATGSAAAALGGYLAVRAATPTATLRWRMEQGFEMGRPSILDIEADKQDGAVTAIRVGGASVIVSQGTMEVP